MRIFGARWTPRVNMLAIQCVCDAVFSHRADRWMVQCPECGHRDNLGVIRARFFEQVRRG